MRITSVVKSNFWSLIFSSFIPLLDYSWRFWEALFYSLLYQLYHNQLHLLQVHLRHTELERINYLLGLLSQTIKCKPGKPRSILTGTKQIVIVLCNHRNTYMWNYGFDDVWIHQQSESSVTLKMFYPERMCGSRKYPDPYHGGNFK